jgi:hypothetical protein
MTFAPGVQERSVIARSARRQAGLAYARAWRERMARWMSGEEVPDCPHVRAFLVEHGVRPGE